MDQYSQPQPSFYQSEVAMEKPRNVIFVTSPIKLILAIVLPGVISAVFTSVVPALVSRISTSNKAFAVYSLLEPIVIFAVTILLTFLLCKNKKEGIMALGLSFFVDSAVALLPSFAGIFQEENSFGIATIVAFASSAINFVITIVLALYLTKNGEKHAIAEPANGYFSTNRKYLIIAAVLITAVNYLVPMLLSNFFLTSVLNFASNLLLLVLLVVFCRVGIKSRKESLLFLGVFSLSSFVTDLYEGSVSFCANVLNIPMANIIIVAIIATLILLAVRVLLLVLMTREKKVDAVGTTEPQAE